MTLLRRCVLAVALALPLLANAQVDTQTLRAAASRAPDLNFPDKVSELSFFTTPAMALYKPAGNGPFPALVLQHQCGGLGQGKRQNQAMLDWARRAVRRGYVALVIDSLSQRGVESVCMGAQGGVTPMRGVRDALQAAAYLETFDFVDKARIAHAGYSWGAMMGLGLSGKHWAEALGDGTRFAAAVSFYPVCSTLKLRNGAPFDVLNPDIDHPLLVLMGEADTEGPPRRMRRQTASRQGCRRAGAVVRLSGHHALLGLREPEQPQQDRRAWQPRGLPLQQAGHRRRRAPHVRVPRSGIAGQTPLNRGMPAIKACTTTPAFCFCLLLSLYKDSSSR